MKYSLFFLFVLVVSNAFSQNFLVKGKVIDQLTNEPLQSATIYAERQKDSTLVSYTISDQNGEFILEGKSREEKLTIFITYTGLKSIAKSINLAEKEFNFGKLFMEFEEDQLGEVIVKTSRSPITLKRDTLEFNAASFNTRENANLEETLKQLPGVEVDAQGNITVNGQPVNRILVNGKEFFGNDPKIATKNLPKEIIDKIQVVDTKTREQEFTGKAGDSENKTINVTIQEDKNKGYFSRSTAGYGTDDRYEASGIFNSFKGDRRFSILAAANNINSPGFSFDEVFDALGSNIRSSTITSGGGGGFGINGLNFGGGNNGITTSQTLGGNYTNEWDDGKYDLTGDYFFGGTDTENRTQILRENILPDRSFFSESETSSRVRNDSHRMSTRFEIKPDSMTRISFEPRLNFNIGENESESASSTRNENGDLINTAETRNIQENTSAEFSSDLTFTRRFAKKGSYLSFNFSNRNSTRDNENFFFSERTVIANNDVEEQNQFINVNDETQRYTASTTYRHSLKEELFLDVSYRYETDRNENLREVFNFEDSSQNFTEFNELLSSSFRSRGQIHTPSLGLNYEGDKIRTGASLGLLNSSIETEDLTGAGDFSNSFNNLFANTFLNYNFSRSKSFRVSYRNNAQIPSIQQLQPVTIVTDPLNIRVGNPDLNPSFSQIFRIRFNNWDYKTRSGYSISGNFTNTDNQVVPVLFTDENLVRTTTFTNVDGVRRANFFVFYNKRMQTDGTDIYRYNVSFSSNYNRNIGFSNEVLFKSDLYTVSPGTSFTYERPDFISINPGVRLNYNNTVYDIFSNRNENFTNTEVYMNATLFWPKGIIFGNDISYFRFGNVSDAFDSTSLLWNVSLGYTFLKDRATLKVKVYDLFNQNIATRRSTGDDFIQDTNQLILTRYAMFSFTYKLSNFGGKQTNQPSGRGGYYRSRRF